MEFVRTVANESFIYVDAVQSASEIGQNKVEYPQGNPLSQNLSIVARLIKGQLGARIYHVSIGGFDNHANQGGANGQHANLLRNLSEAITAFIEDLEADGAAKDVLIATFSEFGRRVNQNGSNGTDHGTAAPMFLFGDGVAGGIFGDIPDLNDLRATLPLVSAAPMAATPILTISPTAAVPNESIVIFGANFSAHLTNGTGKTARAAIGYRVV